ncbi:MAG: M14 family metallopeptidase, partial [Thermoanaerobaculum sp.]|nr:M14 family metallopeptidase [Thermoanaerobaculum sp.]
MRQRLLSVLVGLAASAAASATVPTPEQFLGKPVGQDRVLASYEETVRYLRLLAQRSPRLRLEELGPTVEGRPMVAALIGSPSHMARLEAIRRGWERLANPKGLSSEEQAALVRDLPAGLLITAGIHSTEVAGPQSALLFIHQLVSAGEDTPIAAWLSRVVVMVVPSLNPDGQEAVWAWYHKYLGTPFEGCPYPFLYHRYAGHDNNRDFVFLTQPESRALNRFVYLRWHPQLFVDLHQMGPVGPRQFVPPFADPINPNLPPVIWRLTSHLGTLMALRLELAGKGGVVSGWTFDGHWIGGTRNTAWWKNIVGVLTETASAALATPVLVDLTDLRGGGKGLWDYQPQVNFPNPWRGGRWGLREAVSYQVELLLAALEFAATYRQDLLRETSRMAHQVMADEEGPWGWVVPPTGDPDRRRRLVRLLAEAGAELFLAEGEIRTGFSHWPAGSVLIPFRQPLGRYLREVLEPQRYPELIPAPGADILMPYDVTAWNLPLMLGVEVARVEVAPQGSWRPVPAEWELFRGMVDTTTVAIPASHLHLHLLANDALRAGLVACRLAHAVDGLDPGSLVLQGSRQQLSSLLRDRPVAVVKLAGKPPECKPLSSPRVGVVHPYTPVEDAGWLRWVVEQGGFSVVALYPPDLTSDRLAEGVDVLVLPDVEPSRLVEGPGPSLVPLPPEYRVGLGRAGVQALRQFVEAGGTLLAFGRTAEWAADTLNLPITNTLKGAGRDQFFAPGALVSLEVESHAPLG